jgi:HEAT repeat protein
MFETTLDPVELTLGLVLALLSVSLFLSAYILWHRTEIDRREARYKELRHEWTPLVLGQLAGEVPMEEVVAAVPRRDQDLFADFVLQLVESLEGEDVDGLRAILDACGILERALGDVVHRDRHRAIDAILLLGRMRETRAAPALRQVIAQTSREDVGFAAASTLAQLRDPRDSRTVLDRLTRTPRRSEQSIGQVMLEFGPGVAPELEAVLRSGGTSRRAEEVAIELLGALRHLPAMPLLAARAGTDRSPELRRRAVRALGRLGSLEAAPVVHEAAYADEEAIRLEAVNALRRIGAAESAPVLQARLEDPAPLVRHQAAIALCELGARGRALVEACARRPAEDPIGTSARTALAEWRGVTPEVAA